MKTVPLFLAASIAASATVAAPGCMTELDLDSESYALSVNDWADDVRIDGMSSAEMPALAFFGNKTYMVHNGSSDHLELYWTRRTESPTRGRWDADRVIPNKRAWGHPALVVFREWGTFKLLMSTFRMSDKTWSSPVDVGTANGMRIATPPSAVVVDFGDNDPTNDRLYLAYGRYQGGPGMKRVVVDMFDGSSWTSSGELAAEGAQSIPDVAIGNTGSQLHLVWTTADDTILGSPIWTMQTREGTAATNGSTWAPIQRFGWKNKTTTSILSCGGTTHLLHGGYEDANGIYWSYRRNGQWDAGAKVPGQASDGGAALGCANGQLFMVHNGGTDQLWMSDYVVN
jgi:hypothetical protein